MERTSELPVGHRLVDDAAVPDWMRPIVHTIDGAPLPPWVLHALETAPVGARRSAVLMLLADGQAGPDLLLTNRAMTLRAHAGQPAFPGGELEPGETPVAAALREAQEETALDPDSVIPVAALPELYLGPSGYLVQPVLGYWHTPGRVWAVDPGETSAVERVAIADLANPDHRGTVILRPQTHRGVRREIRTPAFDIAGMVVWGFTASLVDLLMQWGGWSVPWDRERLLTPLELGR